MRRGWRVLLDQRTARGDSQGRTRRVARGCRRQVTRLGSGTRQRWRFEGGASTQQFKATGMSVLGRLAGWRKNPLGNTTVRGGQTKGNCKMWAKYKEEAAMPQAPRTKGEVGPKGKSAVPNATRVCPWGAGGCLWDSYSFITDLGNRGSQGIA